MKQVAAIILNRNLPELADELGEWIISQHGELVDLYVLENGSDPDKRSRFVNIILRDSLGPAGGVNQALKITLAKGYEYFWVNYNDVRYRGEHFLTRALEQMAQYPTIGIFFPFWEGAMWFDREFDEASQLVLYSDILSFVVSRQALEVCSNYKRLPGVQLDPFWDSTNYTAHFNMLATSLALYDSDMCMATDKRCLVYEKAEVANQVSEVARGFSDSEWKHQLGPRHADTWLQRAFPRIRGNSKYVRDKVINQIRRKAYHVQPYAVL